MVLDAAGSHDPLHLLELDSSDGGWFSLLPTQRIQRYPSREVMVAAANWKGDLIVGTNYGRVESLSREKRGAK